MSGGTSGNFYYREKVDLGFEKALEPADDVLEPRKRALSFSNDMRAFTFDADDN